MKQNVKKAQTIPLKTTRIRFGSISFSFYLLLSIYRKILRFNLILFNFSSVEIDHNQPLKPITHRGFNETYDFNLTHKQQQQQQQQTVQTLNVVSCNRVEKLTTRWKCARYNILAGKLFRQRLSCRRLPYTALKTSVGMFRCIQDHCITALETELYT